MTKTEGLQRDIDLSATAAFTQMPINNIKASRLLEHHLKGCIASVFFEKCCAIQTAMNRYYWLIENRRGWDSEKWQLNCEPRDISNGVKRQIWSLNEAVWSKLNGNSRGNISEYWRCNKVAQWSPWLAGWISIMRSGVQTLATDFSCFHFRLSPSRFKGQKRPVSRWLSSFSRSHEKNSKANLKALSLKFSSGLCICEATSFLVKRNRLMKYRDKQSGKSQQRSLGCPYDFLRCNVM